MRPIVLIYVAEMIGFPERSFTGVREDFRAAAKTSEDLLHIPQKLQPSQLQTPVSNKGLCRGKHSTGALGIAPHML